MIVVSRIIYVKVDRRLNVTNKFKYQRRLSSRLAIVMFRGTPCILIVFEISGRSRSYKEGKKKYLKRDYILRKNR